MANTPQKAAVRMNHVNLSPDLLVCFIFLNLFDEARAMAYTVVLRKSLLIRPIFTVLSILDAHSSAALYLRRLFVVPMTTG